MPFSARLAASALALLASAALVSPAAAHGDACDVIPWNPTHQLNNAVRGVGEAQCFPQTHSSWDVTTCLDYHQVPVGGYEYSLCKHVTSTATGNGVSVPVSTVDENPRCRQGWWRTRVTAFIGNHPGVTNTSPDVLIICDIGNTAAAT